MDTRADITAAVRAASKPLLRGWFHAVAAVGALALTVALVFRSSGDLPRLLSMVTFGISMVELYTVSAIYHMGSWRPAVHRVLRALDHSNIFVLIAGTYTPFCVNILSGVSRAAMLSSVWALAAAGTALSVVTIGISRLKVRIPRGVNAALYIAMGWLSIIVIPAFVAALPWNAIALLLLGGATYTAGAIIYALRRPNPLPRVFGFHEVFHALVVVASIAFAVVIWVWIVPFPRA